MAKFNDVTPDDPKVKYFSYGASFEPGWSHFYRLSHRLIFEREGNFFLQLSILIAPYGDLN